MGLLLVRRPGQRAAAVLALRRADGPADGRGDGALDLQTGGGEVLAGIPSAPATLCATESWPPNLALARRNLVPLGGSVVQAAEDDQPLPFRSGELRPGGEPAPTVVLWDEIARVLRPGGRYLSQQIGIGSNRELYEFLMGPQPHPAGDGTRAGACGG